MRRRTAPEARVPTPGSERVIVVGDRRGALDAARAHGVEVVLLTRRNDTGLDAPVVASVPLDEDQWLEWAVEHGDGARAVLACGERDVVPAARLREALDLEGLSLTSAVCATDKLAMKERVAAAGLPCAPFACAPAGGELTRDEMVQRLGLPLVVKTRVGSGGRGSLVCRRVDEVPASIGDDRIAEGFVDGREMSVESMVLGGAVVFSSYTEYLEPRWSNLVPAVLPASVAAEVESLNRRAIAALDVETGMTHLEVFLTGDGVVFGELAARPPGGWILELLGLVHGVDVWPLVMGLELGLAPAGIGPPTRFGAVAILHPGPGIVRSVAGLEEARALPGVVRVRVRTRPGARIRERLGAGQELGHILVTGADRDETVKRLESARSVVRIEVDGEA